ncbi:CTD small phosphatase-like protein 2 [Cryptosporidium felis]|nr:CTD small phosphatase-like protein 2 [Cryptosporidium felis]
MVTFKYRLKRLRTAASEESQEALPSKTKMSQRAAPGDELSNSAQDAPDGWEKSQSSSSQASRSTAESDASGESAPEVGLLRRCGEFAEIMKHLKLNLKPSSFSDDENLLNYCFLVSKPYKNNTVGFTFHVAMENVVSGRPRVLSQPMSVAVEFICCTKFPPRLLHGGGHAASCSFELDGPGARRERSPAHQVLPLPRGVEDAQRPPGLFIVLDMDETLVHCSSELLRGAKPDLLVSIASYSSPWFVYYRPFLKYFLQSAARLGSICVFTASTREYAKQVIDSIDPEQHLIKYKLYREHCTVYNKGYLKDLRTIKGADLRRTVLVDNSLISSTLQLDNAIPVDSWYGCAKDNELLRLLILLNRIYVLGDVRPYLANS